MKFCSNSNILLQFFLHQQNQYSLVYLALACLFSLSIFFLIPTKHINKHIFENFITKLIVSNYLMMFIYGKNVIFTKNK